MEKMYLTFKQKVDKAQALMGAGDLAGALRLVKTASHLDKEVKATFEIAYEMLTIGASFYEAIGYNKADIMTAARNGIYNLSKLQK